MKTYRQFVHEEFWDIFPQEFANKIKQMKNSKNYAAALKDFLEKAKNYPAGKDKRYLADKVARRYRGVEARPLIQHLNKLVKSGSLPQHLSLEQVEEDEEI